MNMRAQTTTRSRAEKGVTVLEFALVVPTLILLISGIATVGLNLSRLIRVAELARSAGSMYVRSVDFSKPGNQDVLVRLSDTLGITRTGGNGAIVLSKVTFLPQSKCIELRLSPCNGDKHVITQRITIGNGSLFQSNIASPAAGLLDGQGIVRNYMREASAIATLPNLTLAEGQFAYIAEAYANGVLSSRGVYSKAVF
jgi:hypothetical protein